MSCGAIHPEDPSRVCRRTGPHVDHDDYSANGTWMDEQGRARLQSISQRAASAKTKRGTLVGVTAAAAKGMREFKGATGGAPPEADSKWSRDEWVSNAERTLLTYLRGHPHPFTTAEAFWPLLDAPQEKRAMSLVVRRLILSRAMKEVSSVRLRGIYRSRNGVEFRENKIVPIYQSLIFQNSS